MARTPSVALLNIGRGNSRTATAGPAAAPTAQQQQQQEQQQALSALLQRAASLGASRAASITQGLNIGEPATKDDPSDTAISLVSHKHSGGRNAAGQQSNGAISDVESPKAPAPRLDPCAHAHTSPGSLESSLPPIRHGQPSPTSANALLDSTGGGTRNPLEEMPLSARTPDMASAGGGGALPPRQVSFAPHQVPDPEQRQQQGAGVAAGAVAESSGCVRAGAVAREAVLWDAGVEWEQGQEQEAQGLAGSPRSSLAARAARARGSLERGSGGGLQRVSPRSGG